jgi:hypothetical protein
MISRRNLQCAAEIKAIAEQICHDKADVQFWEQTIIFAENEYMLRRVQAEKIAIFERLRNPKLQPLNRGDNSLDLAKERLQESKQAHAELAKLRPEIIEKGYLHDYFKEATPQTNSRSRPPGTSQPWFAGDPLQSSPRGERDELAAYLLAMPDIARLDRYEQQARSRRKRALRRLIDAANANAGGLSNA